MRIGETLRELITSHGLNTSELARLTGVGQPVVYRLLSNETDNPKITTLCAIANYFGISVNQLIGDAPLELDAVQTANHKKITIIPWDKIDSCPKKSKSSDEVVAHNITPHPGVYGLRMNDDSMEPIFSKGTILIIDRNKELSDGSYAIVKLKNTDEVVLRQVHSDNRNFFLRPLNLGSEKYKIRTLTRKDRCYGILIQSIKSY
jgi:transcriptional regulator with XRE-family HTH domain